MHCFLYQLYLASVSGNIQALSLVQSRQLQRTSIYSRKKKTSNPVALQGPHFHGYVDLERILLPS